MDLNLIRIKNVVIHDVPTRTQDRSARVTHSDDETPLVPTVRNTIRERSRTIFDRSGFESEFDPETTSPVPGLVFDHLRGRGPGLIRSSQQIANHLFQCQSGSVSPGLLCVMDVTIGSDVGIMLLKVEKETAIQARLFDEPGQSKFTLDYVKDLILSTNTRVFKAAVFTLATNLMHVNDRSFVDAFVSDDQNRSGQSSGIADFFLVRFLGCRLKQSPSVVTRDFFNLSERYFDAAISDGVTKNRYVTALLAEANSEMMNINPQAFMNTHLRPQDRAGFAEHLEENEIEVREFRKDTSLISRRLSRVRTEFSCGAMVQYPPELEGNRVQFDITPEGLDRLMIEDKIQSVRGR